MARQAVSQTYTYYSPDEPRGMVVEDAPLAGQGKAWTLGEYKHPVYPSPLNVRVGDAGIKVWMVIQWLRLCKDDYAEIMRRYGHVLKPEDLDAARWFYERYKPEIDERLADEERLS